MRTARWTPFRRKRRQNENGLKFGKNEKRLKVRKIRKKEFAGRINERKGRGEERSGREVEGKKKRKKEKERKKEKKK